MRFNNTSRFGGAPAVDEEYGRSPGNKRGILVDLDPKKKRVKFQDEDDTVSFWVDVLSKSAKTSKSFWMPDMEDEVWCAVDMKGEDGCVIRSKYNDKDAPPFEGNDDVGYTFSGGSMHLDKASGGLTLNFSGVVRITAARIILDGEVDLGGQGGQLLHRQGDADSAADVAVGSASRVRAV